MITHGWKTLEPGEQVDVVKLRPDGSEATRYSATSLAGHFPANWIGVEAVWTINEVRAGDLVFATGDILHEYFSPDEAFNVFAVFAPDHRLKGWYSNVALPSWMDPGNDRPVIYWHDLFVDLVGFPSGQFTVLDEDHLQAAEEAGFDPELIRIVPSARDEMVRRYRAREFPFGET